MPQSSSSWASWGLRLMTVADLAQSDCRGSSPMHPALWRSSHWLLLLLLQQLLGRCSLRPWTSQHPALSSSFLNASEFAAVAGHHMHREQLSCPGSRSFRGSLFSLGWSYSRLSRWYCPNQWVRSLEALPGTGLLPAEAVCSHSVLWSSIQMKY